MHYRTRHKIDAAIFAALFALSAGFAVLGFGVNGFIALVLALLGFGLSIMCLGALRADDDADCYGAWRDYLYVLPIVMVFAALLIVSTHA